jgi:Peptidase family M41
MRVAYHESGHVISAMRWTGCTASSVTIVPNGTSRGHTRIGAIPESDRGGHSVAAWRQLRIGEAVYFLSGFAAEEVFHGSMTEPMTTCAAANEIDPTSLREELRKLAPADVVKATDDDPGALAAIFSAYPTTPVPLTRMLRLYRFAVAYLQSERSALDALALKLYRERTLDREAIVRTLEPFGLRVGRGGA